MSKRYIMLLIFLTLLLTGCQGEVSESVDSRAETISDTATSADGVGAPVEEEKVIYFKGYGGKENPVRDITPLSGLDSQAWVCLRGTNLAWDDWEPIKHIEEVDGRPPVENAGVTPCPQTWIDRIHSQYPEGIIIALDYDDYDGNGTYEAFAYVSCL